MTHSLETKSQPKKSAEAIRRQNEYLAALHETALGLISRLEVNELLTALVTRACQLLNAPYGYIYLLTPDGTRLERKMGVGTFQRTFDPYIKPGQGVVGRVWETGQPLVINNYDDWAGRLKPFDFNLIQSIMGVPLTQYRSATGTSPQIIGVIVMMYAEESGRSFGDEEVELLTRFAELASIALDNARLFEESTTARQQAEARAEQLALLNRVTVAISSELDLALILKTICREMVTLFNARNCGVALFDETQTKLTVIAEHNSSPDDPSAIGIDIPVNDNLSAVRVIKTGKPLIVHDAQNNPLTASIHHILKARQTTCLAIIPLVVSGQVIGTIGVDTVAPGRTFTESQVGLAETVAGQVANMVENARLYAAAQEATITAEEARSAAEEARMAAEEAKAIAEAASRAKSVFLANMSHELRTPLNAILGFTQLLTRNQSLSAGQKDQLKIINQSGEHLLGLINDVLEMSKIEAGHITLYLQSFDLYRLLDSLEEIFRLQAREQSLALLFQRTQSVPQFIRTDESKLRQILINLLDNAIKYTTAGHISLRVVGQTKGPQLHLQFEVEDSGPGIAPNEIDALFDAFAQSETGLKSESGAGLGLPISSQFAQLMGGSLSVESQLEQGSIFRFNILAHQADASDIEPVPPIRQVIGLEPDQPTYRILVAEDKWANRQLLIKILGPLGFELREAQHGQEAVDIADQWQPHLIWMDMRMPVMDGYEAAKRIKASTKGQATTIIALTASTFWEDRAVILSAGCDDYVGKPFQEEVLFEKMHRHLGVRFIYAEDPEADSPAPLNPEPSLILTPKDLADLSADWHAEVHQAATQAEADLILAQVEAIRTEHPSVAQALAEMVRNFQFDRIMVLTTSEV